MVVAASSEPRPPAGSLNEDEASKVLLEGVRNAALAVQDASRRLDDERLAEDQRLRAKDQRLQAKAEKERLERVALAAAERRARRGSVEELDDEEEKPLKSNSKSIPVVAQAVPVAEKKEEKVVKGSSIEEERPMIAALEARLLEAQAQLASAVLAAKAHSAGISDEALLEASRVNLRGSIDVEDDSAAGVAARRARKLRLQDKAKQEQLERERSEQERAARVAEAAAERRAALKAKAAEAEEARRVRRERALAHAEKASTQSALLLLASSTPGDGTSASSSSSRFGGVSRARQSAAETQADDSTSTAQADTRGRRSRSRSNGRRREEPIAAGDAGHKLAITPCLKGDGIAEEEALAAHSPDLASLLWRKEAMSAPPTQPRDEGGPNIFLSAADTPVSSMMERAEKGGGFRSIAGDLSTGGGEVCRRFRLGKCLKGDACRMRHIHKVAI